jgi:hypothetical protein
MVVWWWFWRGVVAIICVAMITLATVFNWRTWLQQAIDGWITFKGWMTALSQNADGVIGTIVIVVVIIAIYRYCTRDVEKV